MKKFAFFLPQFHQIKENDEWWGEGFTEWINVKNAMPLFKNHAQPQIPYKNNYYNLLDKSTMQWQTELMKKYDIQGMIYYHYYFVGKLLLEKPAENLLNWKDVNQPFFFCWANHSWRRTWNGEQTILIKQEYGNEKEWEKHFDYLLPFFKDSRYEKKNNKPLFMIYDMQSIDMNIFNYFDLKCKENGFDGICIISTISSLENKNLYRNCKTPIEYIFFREPSVSQNKYCHTMSGILYRIVHKFRLCLEKLISGKQLIHIFEGDKLFKLMIDNFKSNDRLIPGLFFSWDNTPRHKERGYIITPPSKELFFNYMDKIKKSDYVFINAWNEWCEGMILEPTKENGYRYLEWIKEWCEKEYEN